MPIGREEMIAAMLASDQSYNGRFITGVLTTGIYCIPSCRARKPKPENVRFFASGQAASEFGLRACKKCRPDEFERGENPEREALETLVAKVRENPSAFAYSPDLGEALKVGPTKLAELFRKHYHTSPSVLLTQTRIETAKRKLLESEQVIAEIAFDIGYENLSVFNDNFKRRTGLTPTEYRNLNTNTEATLRLPTNFNLPTLLSTFSRDPESPSERLEGNRGRIAFRTASGPAYAILEFSKQEIRVKVEVGNVPESAETLIRVFGISQDSRSFEQQTKEAGYGHLINGREGSRILQTPNILDGLIWVIIGQQINLPFAYKLRHRFYEKYGELVGDGLFAPPTPAQIAEIDPDELVALQFSRRKAEYLIGVSALDFSELEGYRGSSATKIHETLMKVKGLGPWSVNYLMMRAYGLMDCVPYGDTGVQSGLRKLYKLEGKIDRDQTDLLLKPFEPYRSLATYHLWQSLKDPQ